MATLYGPHTPCCTLSFSDTAAQNVPSNNFFAAELNSSQLFVILIVYAQVQSCSWERSNVKDLGICVIRETLFREIFFQQKKVKTASLFSELFSSPPPPKICLLSSLPPDHTDSLKKFTLFQIFN